MATARTEGTCEWCDAPNSVRRGRRFCSRECGAAARAAGLVAARPRLSPSSELREAALCGCVTDLPIRHGLCTAHWSQWKRFHPGVTPLDRVPEPSGRTVLAKTCGRCGRLLPGASYRRNLQHCRDCENRVARERDASGPGRRGRRNRRLWFGRTLVAATCSGCGQLRDGEAFRAMRKQGFTCADCHARLTREWAEGNQRDSLSSAVSRGNQWTGPELELLLRDDLSNQELALMLGRTHYTISVMKSKVRNHPKYQAAAGVR